MDKEEFTKYLKKNYPQTSTFISGLSLFIIDAIVVFICIGLGFLIINIFATNDINFKSFVNYSIFIPVVLLVFFIMGLYPGMMVPAEEEVKRYSVSTFFCFGAVVLDVLFTDADTSSFHNFLVRDSRDFEIALAFLVAFLIATILLPATREGFKHFFSRFKWWGVPAVIYCTGNSSDAVINKLKHYKYLGYFPAVIIDSFENNFSMRDGIPVFSPLNKDIINCIHKHNIKTAIITDYHADITPIMNTYRYTISVSKRQTSFTSSQQLKDIAGIIGFSSTHNLKFRSKIFIKRFMDYVLILFGAPIIIPVMLVLSFFVKVTSKGPVFYGHKRVGKNGKIFKCWKFRTMCTNSQEMLEEILRTDEVRRAEWEAERKFQDDPRVTKFGKFLRKTSLDELPQIFNILTGEMSFIGPRPVTSEEMDKYGKYKDYVLSVFPGLTGMWQISGRSETSYEERINFDTYYIQNWSIWLDIWIFIKTIWVVLIGKGAY